MTSLTFNLSDFEMHDETAWNNYISTITSALDTVHKDTYSLGKHIENAPYTPNVQFDQHDMMKSSLSPVTPSISSSTSSDMMALYAQADSAQFESLAQRVAQILSSQRTSVRKSSPNVAAVHPNIKTTGLQSSAGVKQSFWSKPCQLGEMPNTPLNPEIFSSLTKNIVVSSKKIEDKHRQYIVGLHSERKESEEKARKEQEAQEKAMQEQREREKRAKKDEIIRNEIPELMKCCDKLQTRIRDIYDKLDA